MARFSIQFARMTRPLVHALCLPAVLLSLSLTPANAGVELTFNRPEAPGSPINWKIIERWQYAIEWATEGRVSFHNIVRTKGAPGEQLQLLRQGAFDAGYVFNGDYHDLHPLTQLSMLPMVSPSGEAAAVALWRVYDGLYEPGSLFSGAQVLGFVAGPSSQIWSLGKYPIEELEDFERLPVYAQPGTPTVAARQLGADVTRLDRRRLAERFADGVVEGAFSVGIAEAINLGVLSQMTYLTKVPGGVITPTYTVLISDQAWARIGASDRKIIRALSGEGLARRSAQWDFEEEVARVAIAEDGLRQAEASFALQIALQERWKGVIWERWMQDAEAHGGPGFRALDLYLREVEAVSREAAEQ